MKAVFAVRNALVDRTGSAHLARLFLLTAFKKNKFHIAMVYDLLRHRANEAVWSMIRNIFGFPKNTLAICSSIKWIRRLFKGTRRHSKAVAIALASTVYHIWSFRNQVIHDSYRPSLDGLVNIIATDTLRVAFSLRF
nr:uncharacterized protein LOC105974514 [Ipomoea batatas]